MRWVFHVDMDAFFASIEQRDNPDLKGKPVIVGGAQRRGVVAAASYEVRKFGVYSAMPIAQALRRCPQAIVIAPSIAKYAEESAKIMAVLRSYSPTVEPLSLDEAFLDMTGTQSLFGPPREAAASIQREIAEVTRGLTSSVGVAPNKFLAKIASDLNKPAGIALIAHGEEASAIAPLPIRRIWGVGKVTEAKMSAHGFVTIGDVAATSESRLIQLFGASFGARLFRLSHGVDDRPVSNSTDRRSVGSENTFEYDITGRDAVEHELRTRCDQVARHLRAKRRLAKAVRVKVRFSRDFTLQTRQAALPNPIDDGATLWKHACQLLDTLDLNQPIRLVGAAAFDLVHEEDLTQLSLFAPSSNVAQPSEKSRRLEHTMDKIRAKFGDKIKRGE